MKLSNLETVVKLRDRLQENQINIEMVKGSDISMYVGKLSVLHTSHVLKTRMQHELLDYYQAERQLIWSELKQLGVEVDV